MSSLAERKCQACDGGVAPLTRDAAEELRQELQSDWAINMDSGGTLRRAFTFRDLDRKSTV